VTSNLALHFKSAQHSRTEGNTGTAAGTGRNSFAAKIMASQYCVIRIFCQDFTANPMILIHPRGRGEGIETTREGSYSEPLNEDSHSKVFLKVEIRKTKFGPSPRNLGLQIEAFLA
jgi:hypothetical protein